MPELFRTPEIFYYSQYFLNLMSPAGMVPDFGDAALAAELAALPGVLRDRGRAAERPAR